MNKNEFDKVIEQSFSDEPDYKALEEAFQWLATDVWKSSSYIPRSEDFDVVAEAALVCMEKRKKYGWNRRGKTAYEYFSYLANRVYRFHCIWNKEKSIRVKNFTPVTEVVVPEQPSKRWGRVKQSGWKPKTTGE